MVKLFCAIVGVAGSAFPVDIDAGESVGDLKDAIKTKNEDIKVPARDLKLFLAKTKGGEWLRDADPSVLELEKGRIQPDIQTMIDREMMKATWLIQEVLDENCMPALESRQVHVLVKVPTPTVQWKSVTESCPPLSFGENKAIIRIPRVYIEGSGVGDDRRDLLLYLRREVQAEWEAIWDSIIRTPVVLWIVGPPGSGKSCAAFAFACSLSRSGEEEGKVAWIHCRRGRRTLLCVQFSGKSKKQACILAEDKVEMLLASLEGTAAVFLDGYVQGQRDSVYQSCREWHEGQELRRLVVISSMATLGTNFRYGTYGVVPVQVLDGLKSMAISPTKVQDTGALQAEDFFQLTSWTLEEYQEALAEPLFFDHVRAMLTDVKGEVTDEERNRLLSSKFYVVGGNARNMFDLDVESAKLSLRFAIETVDDIESLINGTTGALSSAATNRLIAWHRVGTSRYITGTYRHRNQPVKSLLSSFVARELGWFLGPGKLQSIARCIVDNPSHDGHMLELWFFASLSGIGLQCYIIQDKELCEYEVWVSNHSGDGKVPSFDPHGDIPVTLPKQWLAPSKWNQGGYDAIYVESSQLEGHDRLAQQAGHTHKMLVRFVQVTRAKGHSFKVEYFRDLLSRLIVTQNRHGQSVWIYHVEICFMVPIGRMNAFRAPTSENDFRKNGLEPALPTTYREAEAPCQSTAAKRRARRKRAKKSPAASASEAPTQESTPPEAPTTISVKTLVLTYKMYVPEENASRKRGIPSS